MDIYHLQQIYKTEEFLAKLKNFSHKLEVSEIPVSVVAGKSVKK